MRMPGALIDVKLAENGTTEAVMGNHALDGALDDQLGMAGTAGLGGFGLVPADISGVAHVLLLRFLFTGENGFFRVNNDNMITGIDVVGVDRLVLAPQEDGGLFGHTPDNLVVGIKNIPFAFDLFGFGAESFHREPKIKPRRTGSVKDFRGKNKTRLRPSGATGERATIS